MKGVAVVTVRRGTGLLDEIAREDDAGIGHRDDEVVPGVAEPQMSELDTAITDVEQVAVNDQVIRRRQRHAVVLVSSFVPVEAAERRSELGLVVEQLSRQIGVSPQLQVGRHHYISGYITGTIFGTISRTPDVTARALDESLIAEDVVEVPVAVDDPPDRAPERAQIVEKLVGLPKVGTGVDDEQRIAAPHDTDVQVEGPIPTSEAAITHLVPGHGEILAPRRGDRRGIAPGCGAGR
jgi:hypothetical protein